MRAIQTCCVTRARTGRSCVGRHREPLHGHPSIPVSPGSARPIDLRERREEA